ncbi:T9SS type A sorting domain-containing protein [Nonlabens sp. Asnod3-A02]|uniref:T9SS type A sorting domain-containing protein n=1 Tax=Nonlabens sp. Asnod3-A02 TaxID=3160579 RepID=UPI00386C0578
MRKLIVAIMLCYSINSIGQVINIPDSNLLNALTSFQVVDSNNDGTADALLDVNQDGFIQNSEVIGVETILLSSNTGGITSFEGFQFFTDLKKLNFSGSIDNNAMLLNLESLEEFSASGFGAPNIVSLDFINFTTLKKLTLTSYKTLNLSLGSSTLLEDLKINNTLNLNLSNTNNLVNLQLVDLSSNVIINDLDFSNNLLLQELNLGFTPLGNLNLSTNIQLELLKLTEQTSLQSIVNNLTGLKFLEVYENANSNLSSLNLSNSPNLEELTLGDSDMTSLTIINNLNLKKILIDDLFINNLNVQNLTNLEELIYNRGNPTISFANNNALTHLEVNAPNFSSIDVSQCPNLRIFKLDSVNFSGSLNLSNNIFLETLEVEGFRFGQIDLTNNLQLKRLVLDVTSAPTLVTLGALPQIEYINLAYDNIMELNFSQSENLAELLIETNNLQNLNLKNNGTVLTRIRFDTNNTLNYICVDNANLNSYMTLFDNSCCESITNIAFNSYCSFTPSGSFNEIEGFVSIDTDNNGCNTSDPVFSNLSIDISNNLSNRNIFSDQIGEFNIPTPDGQFTLTPNPENPTYWNFTPPNVIVDFPTQTSPLTQDFCVTANGSNEDLEVIVVPLEQARPGFDTDYKVVVKNKGNVTTSGTVTLDFEEDFMNLLSSTPTAATPATNQLSWSVSNLQPFQMEEYEFTMTLNTPTQTTNPLNGNDILTFTGTVTGTGTDAMPADNTMVFDQTVVNSYDPNDKTCLEGKTIDPSDVGEYVHYMIRFENTGTASAVNIVVKDEIDLAQFDITTLIPLGGSHDYYTRVRDNNVVEFIHEDINLDFNDATNDGYVLFKIKTLSTLVAGDTFDNTADIFFDFNAPIITNTETVSIMSTASVGESTDSSISVYPNPAKNFITATANNAIESISITDMNGRMITATQFTGASNEQRVEIGELSSGIYLVTIKSNAGQKIEKLLVE